MDDKKELPAVETADSNPLAVYNHIFELSRRDYKVLRVKNLTRRSLSFILLLLAGTGLFFTVFYFAFLKDRIESLGDQLREGMGRVERLNREIERLTVSELKQKNQVRLYEETYRNLKIVDERIVDYDLTEAVRKNLETVDASLGEFRIIARGDTRFLETALTFDLGTGEDLAYVYSVLRRYGARATIFVSNEMPSDRYGSLFKERNILYLKKLAEIGCEFGNHTWSHYNLKDSLYETSKRARLSLAFVSDGVLDEATLKLEFDRVREKFTRETGIPLAPYWRAPYGAFDRRILSAAAKAGYPSQVLWSSNGEGPLDFYDYVSRRVVKGERGRPLGQTNPFYFSAAETLARLKRWELADKNGLRGAIAIGHLGTSRRVDKIVYALPEHISYFQSRGYHFVTVTDVLNDRADP